MSLIKRLQRASGHCRLPALPRLFAEYTTPKDISLLKVIARPEPSLPYSVYVGAVGMPGQTSYYGWKEYAKATAGDVVFISTAAGTVGSILVQLAMQDGLEVIAFAGSDEKLGRAQSIYTGITSGGSTLEAAIANTVPGTKIIICGFISQYNDEEDQGIKEFEHQGFRVDVFYERYKQELYQVIPKKLASGEIEYTEDITRGLEKGGEAILEVQKGMNAAKKIIVVADDWRIEAISRIVKSPRNALSLMEKLYFPSRLRV
ncbi:hypothetical protein C8J55DRAFT_545909 [Lentinula edodes]|uniref:NAD(P)-binding protein n=1 Tax=Lentinula lateritia TaxID=40482 RepID=A0A9W9B0E5_9AGAR|nr:hypothetical protein C8J55DRAFT_545909 [Lentinula edodes]